MSDVKLAFNGIDLTPYCVPDQRRSAVMRLDAGNIAKPYMCRRCGATLGHVVAGVLLLDDAACTSVADAAAVQCPTCGAERKWYDIRSRVR